MKFTLFLPVVSLFLASSAHCWEDEFRKSATVAIQSGTDVFIYSDNNFTTFKDQLSCAKNFKPFWMDYSIKHNAYVLICKELEYVNNFMFLTFPIEKHNQSGFLLDKFELSIFGDYRDFALDWIQGLLYLTLNSFEIAVLDLKQNIPRKFKADRIKKLFQSKVNKISDIFIDPVEYKFYQAQYQESGTSNSGYFLEATPTLQEKELQELFKFDLSLKHWHSHRDPVSGRVLLEEFSRKQEFFYKTLDLIEGTNVRRIEFTEELMSLSNEKMFQFFDGTIVSIFLMNGRQHLQMCKINDDFQCDWKIWSGDFPHENGELLAYWKTAARIHNIDTPCDTDNLCNVVQSDGSHDFCVPNNKDTYVCSYNFAITHSISNSLNLGPWSLSLLTFSLIVLVIATLALTFVLYRKRASFYQIRLKGLTRVESNKLNQRRVGEIEIPN